MKWLWRIGVAPFYALRMVTTSIAMSLDRICMWMGLDPVLGDITAEFERMTRASIAREKEFVEELRQHAETARAQADKFNLMNANYERFLADYGPLVEDYKRTVNAYVELEARYAELAKQPMTGERKN